MSNSIDTGTRVDQSANTQQSTVGDEQQSTIAESASAEKETAARVAESTSTEHIQESVKNFKAEYDPLKTVAVPDVDVKTQLLLKKSQERLKQEEQTSVEKLWDIYTNESIQEAIEFTGGNYNKVVSFLSKHGSKIQSTNGTKMENQKAETQTAVFTSNSTNIKTPISTEKLLANARNLTIKEFSNLSQEERTRIAESFII